jgi:hypothetical protein
LTSKGETWRVPLGSAVKNFYAPVMDTLEEGPERFYE